MKTTLLLAFLLLLGTMGYAQTAGQEEFEKGRTADFAKNYTEAKEWYQKGAEKGNAEALFGMGTIYYYAKGLAERNYPEAAIWFTKAAEKGHTDAMYNLGLMKYVGLGCIINYTEAATWFTKAYQLNNTNATYGLGTLYLDGKGVEKDEKKAKELLKIAADKGHKKAIGLLEHLNKQP